MRKIINIKHADCWIDGARDNDGRTELVEVKPGLRVILTLSRYVGPTNCHAAYGEEHWHLIDLDSHTDGVPGNLDASMCELTGWRGTTNDWAYYACGAWVVESVGESRRWEERPTGSFPGERMVRVVLKSIETGR